MTNRVIRARLNRQVKRGLIFLKEKAVKMGQSSPEHLSMPHQL